MTSFWDKQPIRKNENEMIFSRKIYDKLLKFNIESLKNSITFDTINYDDNIDLIVSFLNNNSNNNSSLYFKYTHEYIDILIGNNKIVHIMKKKNVVIGILICGLKKYIIGNKNITMKTGKILAISKSLRNQDYSKYLIKYSINKSIENNIYHGIIFTNKVIKTPNISSNLYYIPLTKRYTYDNKLVKMINIHNTRIKNYYNLARRMNYDDIPILYNKYNEYMDKYSIYEELTYDEFKKLLNMKNNNCYVIIDDNEEIEDFILLHELNIKLNRLDTKSSLLLLYTNTSLNYTSNKIINIAASISLDEKYDIFMLYDNLDNHIYIDDKYNLSIKLNEIRNINLYNWEYRKLKNNEVGYII